MQDAVEASDLPRVSVLNSEFHGLLNKLSRSPAIIAVLNPLSAYAPDDFVQEAPDWVLRGVEEHAAILDALRKVTSSTSEFSSASMSFAPTGCSARPTPRRQEQPTRAPLPLRTRLGLLELM